MIWSVSTTASSTRGRMRGTALGRCVFVTASRTRMTSRTMLARTRTGFGSLVPARTCTRMLRRTTVLAGTCTGMLRGTTVLSRTPMFSGAATLTRTTVFARTCIRRMRRTAVILVEPVAAILARFAHVRQLTIGMFNMTIVLGDPLRCQGTPDHSARSIEGDVDTARHHHARIREDRESRTSYAHQDRRVVPEYSAGPFAADEAGAIVAEAVIHSTVEADVRSPVSGMQHIRGAFESPVRWRP